MSTEKRKLAAIVFTKIRYLLYLIINILSK